MKVFFVSLNFYLKNSLINMNQSSNILDVFEKQII